MQTAIVLAVLVAAALVANALVFRARRGRKRGFDMFQPPPPLPPHRFDPATSLSFRGGARVMMLNVTWPGSRLTIDSERAEMRGMHPKVDIDRRLVTSLGRGSSISRSITFETADGIYDGVMFWPRGKREALLAGLERLGWPIADRAQPGERGFRTNS